MGEDVGEGGPLPSFFVPPTPPTIREKKLSFEEASRCLNTLGKDESGSRYAYLKMTAVDRQLTDVATILNFRHVLFVDLSGNYLTVEALQVLAKMPFLILLKAERNQVESVQLPPMPFLQVLALNQNQIKDTVEINQPLLHTLEMSFNDIYTTRFDTANLDTLNTLEMRSNLLFEIQGALPQAIEKLYLADNKISSITSEDFGNLAHLQVLHLRDNLLQKLDGFSRNQVNLRYLNLRHNQISKFSEFKKLQCLPNLETLVVTGNPLPGAEAVLGPEEPEVEGGKARDPTVIPLLVVLPNLKRINKFVVTLQIRIEAQDMENVILSSLYLEEDQETRPGSSTNVSEPEV